MHLETGEIKVASTQEELLELKKSEDWVEVNPRDMTPKQRQRMRVSPMDNRSKLGKKRVAHMRNLKKRRKSERQRKRVNRNAKQNG